MESAPLRLAGRSTLVAVPDTSKPSTSAPRGSAARGSSGRARAGQKKAGGAQPARSPGAGGRSLRWAIRILYVEAAITALLLLVSIWAALATENVGPSSAAATPAFAALCAFILGGLGYALSRGKAFARSPAIVLEMLMLPMGFYMIDAGLIWVGVPTMIFGLAGAAFLLAPSTRTALGLH